MSCRIKAKTFIRAYKVPCNLTPGYFPTHSFLSLPPSFSPSKLTPDFRFSCLPGLHLLPTRSSFLALLFHSGPCSVLTSAERLLWTVDLKKNPSCRCLFLSPVLFFILLGTTGIFVCCFSAPLSGMWVPWRRGVICHVHYYSTMPETVSQKL